MGLQAKGGRSKVVWGSSLCEGELRSKCIRRKGEGCKWYRNECRVMNCYEIERENLCEMNAVCHWTGWSCDKVTPEYFDKVTSELAVTAANKTPTGEPTFHPTANPTSQPSSAPTANPTI